MLKSKLFRNKKGLNDMSIIAVIISIFILIGITIPYINSEFGQSISTPNVDTLEGDVGDDMVDSGTVTIFSVLFSVGKMFFWTFGSLPFWLDAIFVIFRIILALIIARNIWIGGGA